MSLEVKGGVELRDDVARMADLLRASGSNGTRACNYILQTAAQPVLTRMLHNASTDPKRRSGTLYNSIRIGRVVKKRSGGYRVLTVSESSLLAGVVATVDETIRGETPVVGWTPALG